MRALEFITELFEPDKQNWKWRRQSSDEAFASFVVADREYQWHAFSSEANPAKWEIQFRLMRASTDPDGLDLFGKTGTGNSAQVLSTAVDITRSFLQTYELDKVEEITFNAKEDSRINLYAKMIRRLLPDWDLSSRKSRDKGMQFTLTDTRAYDKPENKIKDPLKELFAPGGNDEDSNDPYQYPKPEHYARSIDFFGQFEAEHFDKEDMNDATGEFKGYWDYDGKLRQIAYFKFDNAKRTGSNHPGMGWYYEPQNEGVAEGDVVPFKQPSNTLTWKQVPKDILLLANDWFWASEDNSGLDATIDPNGFGNGTANDVKYNAAKLQQKGWTIDFNDEYDGPGEFNLRLTNKRGQTVLLSIEDAQDFTGWAEGTNQGLHEFAPGGQGGGDSGRWYTDDELADIIGDDWFEDFDVSHDEFNIDAYGEKAKQNLVSYANTWFDDKGYNVNVLGVEHNDVDHDLKWYIVGSFHNPRFANEGVAEGSLNELANTSLKVKQPKDFVNVNDRKQVTWKVMKFKSGKDTYLINFTMQHPPDFGKKSKSNWNAVNVAFGVKEPQDEYSFGDEINTDLTARNKNQFLIYSTVINAVRKFITEYNTEIDEIIMQGAGERQQAMYQRFFRSAGKYFPGWHYDGKHSLVRDVPRQPAKKVREQGVAEGSQEINWVKPNFDFEWHEVEEQSRMKQVPVDVRQYYQKHFPNKDAWLKAVQNGKAVVVPPNHAYEIRNAPFDKASLQKVLAPTGHEGPIGPAKEKRVNDLFDKGQVEMPIILKTSQGLWLIGGKTRLGTANYVKGLPAKVWLISGEQGVAEGFSNDMSTKDMIAYLRQHHDTNLHQDYLNHLNTFSKFVLKDIPTNTLKTDLPGLDREKVEQYKKMDHSKAPPIVLGGKYILDGYHRANAVKELGIPTIKAYVGVEGMAENFADGKKPGRKGLAKRVGVDCKQPISKLRSIASNSSGERQRMAHWCANMKSGKKK